MMGLAGQKPQSADGKHITPLLAHGVEVMSIGFMIDAEQPMVWRGPMVTQALTQLLGDTEWGELDYLVVDMPPGTGDIQLTLAQRVPVSGAVIVTTPQDIALLDARKGLKMFEKVEVRVLGIVENMSVHVCSNCGHIEHIFGSGGGARMAAAVRGAIARRVAARHSHPRGGGRRLADGGGRTGQRTRTRLSADGAARGGAACDVEQGLQLDVSQDHSGSDLSIKSDRWIRRMASEHGMIEPFSPEQVRNSDGHKIVSYGTSSYGYDVRCADEFKIFTNINSTIVDPKSFDEKSFVDFKGPVCIIPPNSFALASTVEFFRIPRSVLTVCLGKSTYARCGIIVNVTPLEPEWEGHVTLEFSNTTPLPAKIYANEGVAQMLFFESDEVCETSYKDRGGKYQGQRGVTLPKT